MPAFKRDHYLQERNMRGLFFVVMLIVLSMLSGCGNDQDKIVTNYCKALEAGKFDDAVSYLSKSARQELEKAGGKSLLASAADVFKQRKGIKKITISKRDVKGDTAMITFVYNFKDGTTSSDFFPLVKEDGKWKISR